MPNIGTVYGGEIDWVNGVLKVTLCKTTIQPSAWTFQASGVNAWYVNLSNYPDIAQIASSDESFIGYCDKYKIVGYSAMVQQNILYSLSVRSDNSAKRIYVKTDGTNTVEPVELNVVLKLATPIEYDLSSVPEISTKLGVNNIWVTNDGGQVKLLEYPCDTKLYIDKKFAALQEMISEE